MSKLKKLSSMLLALVFAIGMTCTALAAESYTITITDAQDGHTYTAYQVFEGTLSGGKLVEIDWGADVDGTDLLAALQTDTTIGSNFTSCTTAQDVADVLENYNTAKLIAFSAVVADNLADSGTASTQTSSPYTITGLETGYYLVIDTDADGDLAAGDAISRYIVQVISDDVSVVTKTVYPTFDKTADDTSVEVGQVVTFTLTSTVPDTTGYSTYTWEASDTMGDGLTFDGTTTVTLEFGTETITIPSGALVANEDSDGFALTLDMTQYQTYKGQTITVTYTATVNEDAVAAITTNDATLEYSSNPNDTTETEKLTDKKEVYSAKVIIDKYADDDNTDKLAGAKFVLYKTVGDAPVYYVYDDVNDGVSWDVNIANATVMTTGSDGAASFIGLEDGSYYLLETEAPTGYNKLSDPISVSINGANATTADLSSLTVTESITNKSGSTLPTTGGIGTTIFYIVGSVLVLGAVVLLITRKRMNKAE